MAETAVNEMDLYPSSMVTFVSQGACPIPLFVDRAARVSAICCADEACPGATIPAVCSFDCARAFTTFLSDCNEVLLPILGAAGMRKYTEFGNLCTNLDVRSLVTAIHESHCWYCGDGAVDEDEQCDAGDAADECESAPCQNGGVCFDGHGEYHCQCGEGFTGDTCEQEVAAAFFCHDDEHADCDSHASCTHTGPGTHECTCLYGYGGDGRTCTEQGTTRCLADCTLEVHCPALPEVQGATIALSNGNIAPSTATYTCDGGAAPSDGDATRTCQADGSWTGTAPTQCCSALSSTGACVDVSDMAGPADYYGHTIYALPARDDITFNTEGIDLIEDLCVARGLIGISGLGNHNSECQQPRCIVVGPCSNSPPSAALGGIPTCVRRCDGDSPYCSVGNGPSRGDRGICAVP